MENLINSCRTMALLGSASAHEVIKRNIDIGTENTKQKHGMIKTQKETKFRS